MKRILVVDDDVPIGDLLQEALTQAGYAVTRAYSGTEALLALQTARPDLVLLDLLLPGLRGEEVLPHLAGLPVIVVSAVTDVDSRVSLLLGGAVDYVAKPFSTRELLARIALRLQAALADAARLCVDDLALDTASHIVTAAGQPVHLTRTEYAILKLLLQNPAQVLPKTRLLERISLDTPDCTESSLKIHISNLRKKLREATGRDVIEAVWGIGFKLRTLPETLSSS